MFYLCFSLEKNTKKLQTPKTPKPRINQNKAFHGTLSANVLKYAAIRFN